MLNPYFVTFLQAHPCVSAAWLFGSFAQNRAKSTSDVDVAVLFIPGLSPQERFDLRMELTAELQRATGREVDVVDIESAQPFLQHQIRKAGRLLFEKDHRYRVAHDVASRRTFFDLAPKLEQRRNRIISRVLQEANADG